MRYFVLPRRRQWQIAAALAFLALWLVVGTAVIVYWLASDDEKRIQAAVAEARREAANVAADLRRRLAALDSERAALSADLAAAQVRVRSLQQSARQDRQITDRLRREAREEADRAAGLAERLAASNANIDRLRADLAGAIDAGNAARAELARSRQALAESEASRRAVEARLAEVKREHRTAQAKARNLQVAAETRATAAVARVAALRDELARAQAVAADLQAQTVAALAQATAADRRARQADEQRRAAETTSTQLRRKLAQAEAAAADAQARAATALTRMEEADRRAAAAVELSDAAASEAAQLRAGLDDLNQRLRRSLGDEASSEGLPDPLAALRRNVSDVLVARDHARGQAAGLARQVDAMGAELAAEQRSRTDVEADLLDTRRRLAATLVERDKARRDGKEVLGRLHDLRSELDSSAARHHALQAMLADSQALVAKLEAERDHAGMQAKLYRKRVDELEGRLTELLRLQTDLVSEIEDRALATIDGLEETVYATGLNLEELMRRMDKELGIGGPYIDMPAPTRGGELDGIGYALAGPGAAVDFGSALDRLQRRLARWKVLHMALERVPLAPPVDHFYVSSTFGKRKDPFTGKWGMHAGIDMAGPRNTEVRATAPGVVTHAGWMGQYGSMVEIDHGFGLTTRYGHLRKITVKVGQTVAFRDKIGIMGSTGRSTSRHVHYEVRFDGQPVDPAKFIEAGRHVFKN